MRRARAWQHPAARPDRQILGAGEPDLAGAGLPQRLQEGLVHERRQIEDRQALDGDLEPEVEARRADALEEAGDDVPVVAREPGPRQVGHQHHVVGGDGLGRPFDRTIEQIAAGHVGADVQHHQHAGDETDPEQQIDRLIQPSQQAVHQVVPRPPSSCIQRSAACSGRLEGVATRDRDVAAMLRDAALAARLLSMSDAWRVAYSFSGSTLENTCWFSTSVNLSMSRPTLFETGRQRSTACS